MPSDDERIPTWFYAGLVIAAIPFGIGILLASAKMAAATAPWWMLGAMQWLIMAIAVAGGLTLITRMATSALAKASEQLDQIANRYPRQVAGAAKRRPTIAAVLLLMSEAVVIVSGNVFEDEKTIALAASFVLLIGYWASNELLLAEHRVTRMLGILLWFGITAFVPYAIMVARQWTLTQLMAAIVALPLPEQLFFGLAAVVIVVVGLLASGIADHQ